MSLRRSFSKKRIIFIIMFVIAAMLLVSCAGGVNPTATSADPQTTTSSTEQPSKPSETEPSSTETEPQIESPERIRIAALKGPTGMGLAWMADQAESGLLSQEMAFSFAGSPDELTAQLISGQLDIAALPTNLAAVLYQKMDQEIQLLAINTLGVLYVLEAGDTIQSVSDLAERELAATGQGAVPEYVIDYLLADAGIRDQVAIDFKSEHAELATLAVSGQADLVMLPEPFVTTVLSKRSDMRIALDLTEEWQKSQQSDSGEGSLAMGCLVVTRDFARAYPEALAAFLADYEASTNFTNENPDEAGEIIARLEIMADAALAAKAIPNCYITMIDGSSMRPVLEPLLETLLAANPQSVGGALPDDGFYYVSDR